MNILIVSSALILACIWIWRLRKERDSAVRHSDKYWKEANELRDQFRFDHTLYNLKDLVEQERSRLADLKESSTHLRNAIFIEMYEKLHQTIIYRGPRR